MIPETCRCYLVRKTGKNHIEGEIERCPTFELPAGEVLVRVAYSSLNHKDALAATAHGQDIASIGSCWKTRRILVPEESILGRT